MAAIVASESWESNQYALFEKTIDGVDATRIRECPRCKRIYWTNRRDRSYCSPDCRSRMWVKKRPDKRAKIQNRYDEKRRKKLQKDASGEKRKQPVGTGVKG